MGVIAENRDAIGNAIWSMQLSHKPLRGPGKHNSSSYVIVSHSGANLRANDVDQVSPVDRTGHLMRYWSGNDRFHTFDGVCILADLTEIGKVTILSTRQYFDPVETFENLFTLQFLTLLIYSRPVTTSTFVRNAQMLCRNSQKKVTQPMLSRLAWLIKS